MISLQPAPPEYQLFLSISAPPLEETVHSISISPRLLAMAIRTVGSQLLAYSCCLLLPSHLPRYRFLIRCRYLPLRVSECDLTQAFATPTSFRSSKAFFIRAIAADSNLARRY
jgi:hypothetical protein